MTRDELIRTYNISSRLAHALTYDTLVSWQSVEEAVKDYNENREAFCREFLRIPNAGRKTLNEFIESFVGEAPEVAQLKGALRCYALMRDPHYSSVLLDRLIDEGMKLVDNYVKEKMR